jgi:hypothetical protein
MTDYSKETVNKLRQLLKERSIPSTGLTRKAQIIEKLEEWDKDNSNEEDEEEVGDAPETAAAVQPGMSRNSQHASRE